MERLKTLAEQLISQIENGAGHEKLSNIIFMLKTELDHSFKNQTKENNSSSAIVISIPKMVKTEKVEEIISENIAEKPSAKFEFEVESKPEVEEKVIEEEPKIEEEKPIFSDEKVVEELQIDEDEIEAELNEIKQKAETIQQLSSHSKPEELFDPLEDIPTLFQQQPIEDFSADSSKELNSILARQTNSINDQAQRTNQEVLTAFSNEPIKDLKKAIGLNEKFIFINELFRGDETMYERSLKTINNFKILPEAEYWVKRELKLKLGWDDKNKLVKEFDQLVRRRFASI